MSRASEIITEWRPRILFLVIGLVLGPFISGWLGWQVTAETMSSAVQDAVVDYRAELCAQRAQADQPFVGDRVSVDFDGCRLVG